jgi:hypothetical protein
MNAFSIIIIINKILIIVLLIVMCVLRYVVGVITSLTVMGVCGGQGERTARDGGSSTSVSTGNRIWQKRIILGRELGLSLKTRCRSAANV